MEEYSPLINSETKVRVSSTLDKSVGKKYLIDGNPETCWTSQQGTPQFIQFSFPSCIIPRRLQVTFQGGFVGTSCSLDVPAETSEAGKTEWKAWTQIFPEDVNRSQSFDLPAEGVPDGIESLSFKEPHYKTFRDCFDKCFPDLSLEAPGKYPEHPL